MEICSRFTGMERKNGAFLLHTDNADVKVCFVTDEIVRVRASFDHELAEEPYVLMTTAWEDRIKLLPDAALYRSTRIHHTPDSYTKRELVGARPLHLAYARPFCRLKAPLGLSLLRCAPQTQILLCKILVGNTQTRELHPLDAGLASPNEKAYGSNMLSAIGKQLFPVKKENSND